MVNLGLVRQLCFLSLAVLRFLFLGMHVLPLMFHMMEEQSKLMASGEFLFLVLFAKMLCLYLSIRYSQFSEKLEFM